MKILFFTFDIPYPLNSGGKIRAYHLIKQLAKKHEVTLFTFYRTAEQLTNIQYLQQFCKEIIPFQRRSIYSLSTLFHIAHYPFPAAVYFSDQIKKRINQTLQRTSFDLIHFESFYTSMYIDSHTIPQVLGTENIEWRVYSQYTHQQPSLLRPFLNYEVMRIKSYEQNSWRRATHCLAVSDGNAREIQTITHKPCTVIPNGIDVQYFSSLKHKKADSTTKILFVGNMRYIQNKDACEWLLTAIVPEVKKVLKDHPIKFIIVGAESKRLQHLADTSLVELLGEVSDMKPLYEEASIVVTPIRVGSGTKFKILEAAAAGIPIVTTLPGIEGIDHMDDGSEILVARNAHGFAQQIARLIENKPFAAKLAERAKKVVEKEYSWETIGKKLNDYYEEIINHHR